ISWPLAWRHATTLDWTTMASSPSLRTVIAAVVAPLVMSIRMGLTWNEPARASAAASDNARTIQGTLRRAVTVVCMRDRQPSCAAWSITSEVYRRHDRIGIGSHAHTLASRNRPADAIAAQTTAVRNAGREGLRPRRPPSR